MHKAVLNNNLFLFSRYTHTTLHTNKHRAIKDYLIIRLNSILLIIIIIKAEICA
jgi:hypothetical protein